MSRHFGFCATLFLVGVCLHAFRLGQPDAIVFDEVHFGKYAQAYCCTHEYFFDIHPPHGKLLPALALKLGGHESTQAFEQIGAPLGDINPVLLRFVPALMGTLIPLLVFTVLLQLGASPWAAFLGAWAALFDNALLLQTRILALDGGLVLASLCALSLALASTRELKPVRQLLLALGAGAFIGLAVGTKMTGLASGLIVAVVLAAWPEGRVRPGVFWRLSAAGLGAIAVYLIGWVLHFMLLGNPGPGDIWGAPTGDLVADIVAAHQSIMSANANFTAKHPSASAWWGWPFMWRPIFYFTGAGGVIYFVGNPIVWWGTAAVVTLILLKLTHLIVLGGIQSLDNSTQARSIQLMLVAFVAFFLPFMLISRIMFLYHYLPALIFAICVSALWLDSRALFRNGPLLQQSTTVIAIFCAIPVGFILVSPLTFGAELPPKLLSYISQLVH